MPMMVNRLHKYWLEALIAFVFIVIGGAGCKESLPPYHDPREVLNGEIRARYTLALNENSVKIEIRFTNIYDETLHGVAALQGGGTITLKRKSSVRKTFEINASQWISGKYVPSTRVLTVDPGDTVRLIYTWDFRDDNGNDLRTTEFRYYADPQCHMDQPVPVERNIAGQETFVIQASLKVFDRIPEIVIGPIEFSMCHVDKYVAPSLCPPIFPERACESLR